VTVAVLANGVRLLVAAGGAYIAIHWMGLGALGVFAAIASAFAVYAALTIAALSKVAPRASREAKARA
jgi:hypothetical protein